MNQSRSLMVAAVAAALATLSGGASAAGPGPTYFGGGATLPAIGYVGTQATTSLLTTAPAYNLNSGGEVSAFGYFDKVLAANVSSTSISYCQTGSGAGKRVFYGATSSQPSAGSLPTSASSTCGTTTTTVGFGATNGQKFADFAASDSPQSVTEYNFYKTNSAAAGTNITGRGQPVQLPAVTGSVALLYNNPDANPAVKLNLTTAQLCRIFAGQITNWNQLGLSLPSRPLTVIYRSDGSGTTFSFSNYLSSRNASNARNVCTAAGQTFALDQSFVKVFPGGSIPSTVTNFVGASGNPGVVAKIAGDSVTTAVVGSIGYVEAANALAAANKGTSDGINFATLGGKDPIKNLPEAAAAIPASAIVKDKAIGAYVVNGRPTLDTITPLKAGCTLLANPSSYSNLTSGYPIVAVSYLLFSSAGNGSGNLANLRSLGQFLTKSATYAGSGPVNTINKATSTAATGTKGYSSLPLTTGAGTIATTVQTAATSCIGS